MENWFGRPKTPKELCDEHRGTIRKARRAAERQQERCEDKQKELIAEIKAKARDGASKQVIVVMARSLVRQRKQEARYGKLCAQLDAVADRIAELQSVSAMTEAMAGVSRAVSMLNGQMDLARMERTMRSFERNNEIMDKKVSMIDEVIDGIMGSEDEKDETDEVVSKVLDEIGIDLNSQLKSTPTAGLPVQQAERAAPARQAVAAVPALSAEDIALEERLKKLNSG
jgi:charged multivesicular body protein 2A